MATQRDTDDPRCDGRCSGQWTDPDCTWHGNGGVTLHQPRRGDEIETWIKRVRDRYPKDEPGITDWYVLDDLLDDYREHADCGVPLSGVIEGPYRDE